MERPRGGALVGMHPLVKVGAVRFLELATVSEGEEGLLLRIRHFHPDPLAREEKDAPQAFPLLRLGKQEPEFDGGTYRVVDGDTLQGRPRLLRKDGTVSEDVHRYRRVQDG